MKCPKCGSNNLHKSAVYINKMVCKNCNKQYELKEISHQQRLDKVLAKFEEGRIYLDLGNEHIGYYDNEFYLEGEFGNRMALSIDTVESLIKDLEAKDNESL